ncbi:MAG: CBS domain-containing protein [Deltaproteobacteria bacterium]|nr:CBS domain-containing protein [Deltaproteobacteria bacterium]
MSANKKKQNGLIIYEEIITTHVNADFDALASMIAAGKLYPDAALVFPGSQEKNLRNFFLQSASYLFNFAKLKQVDFDHIKKLIIVDTRQKDRIGRFAELLDRDDIEIHLYDHHPDTKDDIHGVREVVRETGATTTIIVDLIRENNIPLNQDEITIMCLGIHEDTGSFTFSSTTPSDHMAASWLVDQGANLNIVSEMLSRELTSEHIWILNDLTKSATKSIINGVDVVISTIIREQYMGDLAVLVHKYMDMENIEVLFVIAEMGDRIYLVGRSRLNDVNVAEIVSSFGGGGHSSAASATIKGKTIVQVERSIKALLRSRINPQKLVKDTMSAPVIQIRPEGEIKDASILMTKYNINVLLVIDKNKRLLGYITRQILEKAVFFGLGNIQVREYMNIDIKTIGPDASLSQAKDTIIKDRLRLLAVVEDDIVIGVITRTDLLSILVGGPEVPDFIHEFRNASHFTRKKNIASLLKERLPRRVIEIFKEFGDTADTLGYAAYLVGGLVRDILLKQENLDVDVVVEGDGIAFAREYAANHDVRVRSHKKFGTAVLIFPNGFKVDVATARMEYYETPAALPTVEISSLKMDLFRRDFVINTLAIKLNKRDYGTLIDYFGGQNDLKEKVIRVLHNLSFVEDPTRVLRAIRFEQRFGFKISKLSQTLMKNTVKINSFKDLSGRRLYLELKLILMENQPVQAIERMNQFDLLQFISPEIKYTKELQSLLESIVGVISWFNLLYLEEPFQPWKIYWHGLTSQLDKKEMKRLAQRMQMNELEKKRMVSQAMEINTVLSQIFKIRRDSNYAIYTLLSQYDTEILLYMMARTNNEQTKKWISFYFNDLRKVKVRLQGSDLKMMGFKPGPVFKKIFSRLMEARLNNQLNTKEEEIEFIRKEFKNHLK